jgi:hypothetical protein
VDRRRELDLAGEDVSLRIIQDIDAKRAPIVFLGLIGRDFTEGAQCFFQGGVSVRAFRAIEVPDREFRVSNLKEIQGH